MKKCIAGFLLALISFCTVTLPAHGQTVIFSDSFDAGLDNWESAYGPIAQWGVQEGSAVASIPHSFGRTEITPKLQWDPSWQHYTITFDYYPEKAYDKNLNFGFRSNGEWYEFHFVRSQYYIYHVVNHQAIWIDSGWHSLLNGQTHKIKLELNAGQIKLWINNSLLHDAVDPTYTGSFGKPTLKATTGSIYPSTVRFDNFVITLNQSQSTLATLKQTDPAWALEEYDHANSWDSVPTIERWGCALTSLAMIFHYHGITQFADGTPLTPSSLNHWLKNAPDGYIGAGLVNWIAAMRLTHQLAPLLNTPKLEYARHVQTPLQTAQAQLAQTLPVILQIPGHFLVGHSLEGETIAIADPYYEYQTLAEHQTTLVSTRSFTPSQTDLSYILLVHQPDLTVQLDGNLQATSHTEYLRTPSVPLAESAAVVIQEVAQPESGEYTLTISSEEIGPFELELFMYDVAATVQKHALTGVAGPEALTYRLHFDKTTSAHSSLTPAVSFQTFKTVLETFFGQEYLTYTGLFHLSRYVGAAVAAEQQLLPEYSRYTSLLQYYLQLYNQELEPAAQSYLSYYLSLLEQYFTDNPV